MTKWVIYCNYSKDTLGWMRLSSRDTRKKAREYVKTAKQDDIDAQYPFFKYRIVKEQV